MQGDLKSKTGRNMALEELTLAETLKTAGYRTALFGKWHLGAHRDHGPMKQGFDEFFGIRDGFIDNFNHYFLHGDKGYHDLYEGTTEVTRKGDYFPEMIVSRSLEFIERNRDRPFFLYLGFNIPHYPEQALKEHAALYRELPMPRRSYAAVVTTTDHYIGKILDRLEKLGLRKDTIVIFQSDNGHSTESYAIRGAEHASGYPKGHRYGANGGGGNTGKWIGGKGTFLEGGIRTPAIISYPAKLPKGAVRGQIITAMDWFPTVLSLCGVKQPAKAPKLDGFNLHPIIHDAKAQLPRKTLHFAWGNKWAVREGDWKLIGVAGRPRVTLHNLADAKPEVKNYANDKPKLVDRLRMLHMAWAKDVTPKRQ
jgi:arylsulfatase A-like enzyme